MVASSPVALLFHPPPTAASLPAARLPNPPATVEASPLAVLSAPPPTTLKLMCDAVALTAAVIISSSARLHSIASAETLCFSRGQLSDFPSLHSRNCLQGVALQLTGESTTRVQPQWGGTARGDHSSRAAPADRPLFAFVLRCAPQACALRTPGTWRLGPNHVFSRASYVALCRTSSVRTMHLNHSRKRPTTMGCAHTQDVLC